MVLLVVVALEVGHLHTMKLQVDQQIVIYLLVQVVDIVVEVVIQLIIVVLPIMDKQLMKQVLHKEIIKGVAKVHQHLFFCEVIGINILSYPSAHILSFHHRFSKMPARIYLTDGVICCSLLNACVMTACTRGST